MKTLIKVSFLFLTCFLILFILIRSTELPNDQNNGFSRKWTNTSAAFKKSIPIDIPLKSISGISNSLIYIVGQTPTAVLVLDKELVTRDTIVINLDINPEKMVPSLLTIDSPKLYLHLNNLKEIVFGEFPNKALKKTSIKAEIFTKSVQISDSALIIRSIDPNLMKQTFQKVNCLSGEILKQNEVIPDQRDGGISTDGMLVYDKASSKVIYIQYLNNAFYCLDTNLNVLYKGKTIDTVSFSNVSLKYELNNELQKGKLLPSAARIVVNKMCFVSNGYLFIVSGLKSDNESLSKFNRNSTIDVYNIEDGKYVGSFYIPKLNNKQFKSAIIDKDNLITLYDKEIAIYTLPTILKF